MSQCNFAYHWNILKTKGKQPESRSLELLALVPCGAAHGEAGLASTCWPAVGFAECSCDEIWGYRSHKTLRVTPAMESGLTDHPMVACGANRGGNSLIGHYRNVGRTAMRVALISISSVDILLPGRVQQRRVPVSIADALPSYHCGNCGYLRVG
jgi:hypothetical protein